MRGPGRFMVAVDARRTIRVHVPIPNDPFANHGRFDGQCGDGNTTSAHAAGTVPARVHASGGRHPGHDHLDGVAAGGRPGPGDGHRPDRTARTPGAAHPPGPPPRRARGTILAAVEAARHDLAPEAEPNGTLRVAGFATAIREHLLPVITGLAQSHPHLHVLIREHEPAEALQLLAEDTADLALTYDYNLAPAAEDAALHTTALWTARWGLGVPAAKDAREGTAPESTTPEATTLEVFARFAEHDWIVNSRNTADETVIRTLASMAGFTPRITHQADSLDLVQGMITANLGVGLLPMATEPFPAVRLLPLTGPDVELRAYAVAGHGRLNWPPLALVTDLLLRRTTTGRTDGHRQMTDDE